MNSSAAVFLGFLSVFLFPSPLRAGNSFYDSTIHPPNIEAQIIHKDIYNLKFAPGDSLFFTYTARGEVSAWDAASLRQLRRYLGHRGSLLQLWVAGDKIITCNSDSLFFWDPAKSQVEKVMHICDSTGEHERWISGLALFHKNHLLIRQQDPNSRHDQFFDIDLLTGRKRNIPGFLFEDPTDYNPVYPYILGTRRDSLRQEYDVVWKQNGNSWDTAWMGKREEISSTIKYSRPSFSADGRFLVFQSPVNLDIETRTLSNQEHPCLIVNIDGSRSSFLNGTPVYYYVNLGNRALIYTDRWHVQSAADGWQLRDDSAAVDQLFRAWTAASGSQWYNSSYYRDKASFDYYPERISYDLQKYITCDTNSLTLFNLNEEKINSRENKVGIPGKIFISNDEKSFLVESIARAGGRKDYWEWRLGEAFPVRVYNNDPGDTRHYIGAAAARYHLPFGDTLVTGNRYRVDHEGSNYGYYKGVHEIVLIDSAGKITRLRGHIRKPNSWIFNKKQTLLASVALIDINNSRTRDIKIWNIEKAVEWKRMLDVAEEFNSPFRDVTLLSFSSDDKFIWGVYEKIGLVKWEINNGLPVTYLPGSLPCAIASGDSLAAATVGYGEEIAVYDTRSGIKKWTLTGHTNSINDLRFTNDNRYLVSTGNDGKSRLWDLRTGREVLNFIQFGDGLSYTLLTPEQYYLGSRNSVNELSFVLQNKAYSYEQFDLALNRPDKVLKQVEAARNQKLIMALESAWKKRVRTTGLSEREAAILPDPGQLPVTELKQGYRYTGIHKDSIMLPVSFSAPAGRYLDHFQVKVNGAPQYAGRGFPLNQRSGSLDSSIIIPLSTGKNYIQVYCSDQKNRESLRKELFIESGERTVNPKRIFIGVGISRYKDSGYNLVYPSKDVEDLSHTFYEENISFRPILLLDQEATRENILALKKTLSETSVNDEVILSLNGHGLIDSSLNFYFATYDVNFKDPPGKGLSYADISSLFDGIPARRKLILMDACHSGPIDRENKYKQVLDTLSDGTQRGGIIIMQVNEEETSLEIGNTFKLMQNLFTEISDNNGAIVIAAAGGDEYAFENSRWKNGVFTYCVRRGIEDGSADLDKDGRTDVNELKRYVATLVEELTNGRQKPTSRQDNPLTDWIITRSKD